MKLRLLIAFAIALPLTAAPAAMQPGGKPAVKDIWKPAPTPKGGTAWSLLEATKETTRTGADGYIRSKPVFPAAIRALNGKQVTVSGYMAPLENGSMQKHFVLLAYPPGCPFHMHAMPNQFIEIRAVVPFPVSTTKALIVTGTLQLAGQDESGIFYKLNAAKPG